GGAGGARAAGPRPDGLGHHAVGAAGRVGGHRAQLGRRRALTDGVTRVRRVTDSGSPVSCVRTPRTEEDTMSEQRTFTDTERNGAGPTESGHGGDRTTEVVVVGGGYAGVMAANRLTRREDVRVTLVNPRREFVNRVRLHQLVAGTHEAVVDLGEVLSDRVRLVVDSVTR